MKIIENKMTRKINLILHELEVYVKRFIVWYKGIRSPLAIKPPIFTDESSQLSSKLYMFWFSTWTRCGTGHEILLFFSLWLREVRRNQNKNKTKRFTRQRQKQTGRDLALHHVTLNFSEHLLYCIVFVLFCFHVLWSSL